MQGRSVFQQKVHVSFKISSVQTECLGNSDTIDFIEVRFYLIFKVLWWQGGKATNGQHMDIISSCPVKWGQWPPPPTRERGKVNANDTPTAARWKHIWDHFRLVPNIAFQPVHLNFPEISKCEWHPGQCCFWLVRKSYFNRRWITPKRTHAGQSKHACPPTSLTPTSTASSCQPIFNLIDCRCLGSFSLPWVLWRDHV